MIISFRVDKEFEELMKRLSKEGNRTKWINDAISFYLAHDKNQNDLIVLEKLEEIKELILTLNKAPIESSKINEKNEEEGRNDQEQFYHLLSTGLNQGL